MGLSVASIPNDVYQRIKPLIRVRLRFGEFRKRVLGAYLRVGQSGDLSLGLSLRYLQFIYSFTVASEKVNERNEGIFKTRNASLMVSAQSLMVSA